MTGVVLNRLLPAPCEQTDAAEAYAYPTGTTRHLRVNMVSTVDGAATLGGRVGTLTGPADQGLLVLLRALADVLLVGAGTIRAEGYGPLTVGAELLGLRAQQGQGPAPRLVVPSRSLDLDFGAAAFTEAVEPPLVVTARTARADRLRAAEAVAEVAVLGDSAVDAPWWICSWSAGLGGSCARVAPRSSTGCSPPTWSTSSASPSLRSWSAAPRAESQPVLRCPRCFRCTWPTSPSATSSSSCATPGPDPTSGLPCNA
jgi:hypothetical protein